MGAKAGWPDFILVPPTRQLHCLELKRLGEALSEPARGFSALVHRPWSPSLGRLHRR
jgi:hypothetical protein